jgi:DNA-binding CsgD family transcriptional regulator
VSAATATVPGLSSGAWLDRAPKELSLVGTGASAETAADYCIELDAAPVPGVVIVNDALKLSSWTPGARAWVEAVQPDGRAEAPGLLRTLVERLAVLEEQEQRPATVRVGVRTGGGWAVAQADRLEGAGGIAISIGPASGDQALDLFSHRYGLTPREHEIVNLLAEGLDTRALTGRLYISRHTLQDHLKSIFRKTGVRSRLKLVALATA